MKISTLIKRALGLQPNIKLVSTEPFVPAVEEKPTPTVIIKDKEPFVPAVEEKPTPTVIIKDKEPFVPPYASGEKMA